MLVDVGSGMVIRMPHIVTAVSESFKVPLGIPVAFTGVWLDLELPQVRDAIEYTLSWYDFVFCTQRAPRIYWLRLSGTS